MCNEANPWIALPSQPSYVLPCDEEKVTIYSARARGDYKLQLDLMPEPFIGLPDAPVVLLNLNPGFDPEDPEVHRHPKYRDVLRNNCCHVSSQFPFFFLHPDFREKPGGRWWRKKLKCLLEKFGKEDLHGRYSASSTSRTTPAAFAGQEDFISRSLRNMDLA